MAQALDAGVTIPLRVASFDELTRYFSPQLRAVVAGQTDSYHRANAGYVGNFEGLGSVHMVVPHDQRLRDVQFEPVSDHSGDGVVEVLLKPSMAAHAGNSLGLLREMGYTYSGSSAHLQNLYAHGGLPQADNSDLVALGDLQGQSLGDHWFDATVTAENQRSAVLYATLTREMVPPAVTLAASSPRVAVAQRAFWRSYLPRHVPKAAVRHMAVLYPYLETVFQMAAARLCVDDSDRADTWSRVSRGNARLRALFGGKGYDLEGQHQQRLKSHANNLVVGDFANGVDRLGVRHVVDFLRSGQRDQLMHDPHIRRVVELIEQTAKLPRARRERVLRDLAGYLGRRDLLHLGIGRDTIALFDGAELRRVAELIREHQPEAVDAARVLVAARAIGERSAWVSGLTSAVEESDHHYLRRLIGGDSPRGLRRQAEFELTVKGFATAAASNLPGYSIDRIFNDAFRDRGAARPPSIEDQLKPPQNHGFNPANLVAHSLFRHHRSARDRLRIRHLARGFGGILRRHARDLGEGRDDAAIAEVEALSLEARRAGYPALGYGLQLWIAGIHQERERPQAMADAITRARKDYFPLIEVPAAGPEYDTPAYHEEGTRLAEEYRSLGLPHLAKFYRHRAAGDSHAGKAW